MDFNKDWKSVNITRKSSYGALTDVRLYKQKASKVFDDYNTCLVLC